MKKYSITGIVTDFLADGDIQRWKAHQLKYLTECEEPAASCRSVWVTIGRTEKLISSTVRAVGPGGDDGDGGVSIVI